MAIYIKVQKLTITFHLRVIAKNGINKITLPQ